MITIDALGILMYAQLLLSIVLFLALQIISLLASHERFEYIGEWLVCRGTWIGMGIQAVSMMVLSALVFYTQTDHTRVTYTVILIVANAIWFISLRLAFLFSEYRNTRQVNSLK